MASIQRRGRIVPQLENLNINSDEVRAALKHKYRVDGGINFDNIAIRHLCRGRLRNTITYTNTKVDTTTSWAED